MNASYHKTEYEIIRDMKTQASDDVNSVQMAWAELLEQEGLLSIDVALAISGLRDENRTERALRLLKTVEDLVDSKLLEMVTYEREMDIAAAESRMGD